MSRILLELDSLTRGDALAVVTLDCEAAMSEEELAGAITPEILSNVRNARRSIRLEA